MGCIPTFYENLLPNKLNILDHVQLFLGFLQGALQLGLN